MPLRHHRGDHEIGDLVGFAGAEESSRWSASLPPLTQRREQARKRYRGALDVVVEDTGFVAVLAADVEGGVVGEVLEPISTRNASRAAVMNSSTNSSCRSGEALLQNRDNGIAQKLLIIGADVRRQAGTARMYARRRVERQRPRECPCRWRRDRRAPGYVHRP
jgi:hypothetical protein